MKFKMFLEELEELEQSTDPVEDGPSDEEIQDVIARVREMDDEEIENFAQWLYFELFDEEEEGFEADEVEDMIYSLDKESLDYVSYVLSDDYEDDEDDGDDSDLDDAGVVAERKFFKTRKKALARAKKKNIMKRRIARKKRKRYYRQNKSRLKIKRKVYARKVKRQPNIVRHHR